jgi:hypothetical protein
VGIVQAITNGQLEKNKYKTGNVGQKNTRNLPEKCTIMINAPSIPNASPTNLVMRLSPAGGPH